MPRALPFASLFTPLQDSILRLHFLTLILTRNPVWHAASPLSQDLGNIYGRPPPGQQTSWVDPNASTYLLPEMDLTDACAYKLHSKQPVQHRRNPESTLLLTNNFACTFMLLLV